MLHVTKVPKPWCCCFRYFYQLIYGKPGAESKPIHESMLSFELAGMQGDVTKLKNMWRELSTERKMALIAKLMTGREPTDCIIFT